MRADLLVELNGEPGQRFRVIDRFYDGLNYRLLELVYMTEQRLRVDRSAIVRLPPNPMVEPDLKAAERHQVTLGGGMMGQMRSALMGGKRTDIRTLVDNGLIWAINGVAAKDHVHDPLLTLAHNRSYIIDLVNDSAWHHPMHIHGHSFRVISRNGHPTRYKEWQDTVLLAPRERVEIALVADNPGDWMFHCHILEHQEGGMMGVIRVV
jgi:FtsP/CotA-like multicopper oxidase with cupredoxin domain